MAPTSVGIVSAAKALQDEGLCDSIKVSGLGDPTEMISYIENGCAPEFALWSFVDLGYLTYYASYLLATGAIQGVEGESLRGGTPRHLHHRGRSDSTGHRRAAHRDGPVLDLQRGEPGRLALSANLIETNGGMGNGAHPAVFHISYRREMAEHGMLTPAPAMVAGLQSMRKVTIPHASNRRCRRRNRIDPGRARSLRAFQGEDPSRCPRARQRQARSVCGRHVDYADAVRRREDDGRDRAGAGVLADRGEVDRRAAATVDGADVRHQGGRRRRRQVDAGTDGRYESALHRGWTCRHRRRTMPARRCSTTICIRAMRLASKRSPGRG